MGGSLQDANSNPINLGPYINPRPIGTPIPNQVPYGMGGPMTPMPYDPSYVDGGMGAPIKNPIPQGLFPVVGQPYTQPTPIGANPVIGGPIGGYNPAPIPLQPKPAPLPGRPIIDPAAPGSQGSVYGQQPTRGPAPRDVTPYTLQQGLGGLGRKV